jgi:hypothetical protein
MSSIRVHLDAAEHDAVARLAEMVGVSPEDVAYAALNRLMLIAQDPEVVRDIADTRDWRRYQLPAWSDSAGGMHPYESMPAEEPRRRFFG